MAMYGFKVNYHDGEADIEVFPIFEGRSDAEKFRKLVLGFSELTLGMDKLRSYWTPRLDPQIMECKHDFKLPKNVHSMLDSEAIARMVDRVQEVYSYDHIYWAIGSRGQGIHFDLLLRHRVDIHDRFATAAVLR